MAQLEAKRNEDFKQKIEQLHENFTQINKEIEDNYRKQNYGQTKWYPQIVGKV